VSLGAEPSAEALELCVDRASVYYSLFMPLFFAQFAGPLCSCAVPSLRELAHKQEQNWNTFFHNCTYALRACASLRFQHTGTRAQMKDCGSARARAWLRLSALARARLSRSC